MTTLIAVYSKRGCVGRCDATCHLAQKQKCTCICGGRNHGVGSVRAEANVKEMLVGLSIDDLMEFAQTTKRNPQDLTVVNRLDVPNAKHARHHAYMKLAQLDLFEPKSP